MSENQGIKKKSVEEKLNEKTPMKYITEIKRFIDEIDKQLESKVSIKNENAFSFWHSSHMLKSCIIEAIEEDESELRVEAIICDIFNGFAHASKESQGFRDTTARKLFALKDIMIDRIISVCEKEGSKAYGYAKDENGNQCFVVDIPETGQIMWHDPRNFSEEKNKYPYKIDKKDVDITNKSFLERSYQNFLQSEINQKFEPHTAIVIQSFDVEEMNNNLTELYDKREEKNDFLSGLQSMVAEPSPEELNITSSDNSKELLCKLPGENN